MGDNILRGMVLGSVLGIRWCWSVVSHDTPANELGTTFLLEANWNAEKYCLWVY